MNLNLYETRIIGCLIEKSITTPEQYPLSLNALVNACNQKSNRDPVLELKEAAVQDTLDGLIKKFLVGRASSYGSRVTKYQHRFCNTEFGSFKLSEKALGIICELFLRGPQTPGELRTRTERLCKFADVNEVEAELESLMARDEPLVAKLPREPGKRESRYAHLFSGKPQIPSSTTSASDAAEAIEPSPRPELMETDAEWGLRIDLSAALHLAVKYNLHEGIANHFSAVLPDGEHFLVNPFGLHFSEVTASNLLVCDFAGKVVKGDGEPSASAHHIHAPIHRLVPRAQVLMHTHQPYATALTMLQDGSLEWALHTACRFYGRVAYDVDYDGVALADSVGERMAGILGDAEVLFLGNHGVMTAAPSIAQAFDDLYFLERVAQTQLLAMSTGRPLALLEPKLIEQVAGQLRHERFDLAYIEKHFAAQKRLLDAVGGHYRR